MSWNVAAVMTKNVVTVSPGSVYKDVAECLRTCHVSAVPVVDSEDRVIGVVSEADLLLKEERPEGGPGGPLLHPHGDAAKAEARNAAALMTAPADESIREEVRVDVLHHALAIDPATVVVTVADGIVRLDGQLERKSLAPITARLVQAVEGVVAVENRLTWKWDDTHVDVPAHPLALRYPADERP